MRAPTHAAFGLVFAIVTGTALGLVLTPGLAACVLAGALLPDLDDPASPLGRLAPPLGRWLARRVGPRTLTHSLLGLGAATVLALPLALVDPGWPLAVALGYASHLLLDCATLAGVPLGYPSPLRAVLPRADALRLAPGAPAEWVLLAALLVALAALLPLQQVGFARALHALTRTTGGAIADYRAWQGRREVWVDVEGTFQRSGQRVRARYRVLGLANTSTLVVLDPATGRRHTVGPTAEAHVYPVRIRAEAGRPVTVRTRAVALTQQLLGDLLRELPAEGETFLEGEVRTPDPPALRPDPEQFAALRPGVGGLELRFARRADLEAPEVRALFVVAGVVLVQTTVVEGGEGTGGSPGASGSPGSPARSPAAPPEYDDVTELFIAHLTDPARELLVRDGDRVRRGQLLARLGWKDPELARRRETAEAERAERQAALALRTAALAEARALVEAGLAAPGLAARAEAERLQAAAALARARHALAQLAEEATRAAEIRAPVDGQVLTVRVHVIHGGEGTAALRLLYRRRPAAPAPPPA